MFQAKHTRTSFSRRLLKRAVPISVALLLVVAWLTWSRLSRAPEATMTLAELTGAIERGEPSALARAKEAANREWPLWCPVVQAMLSHDSWRIRAGACEILAARADERWLEVLLPRCSDDDWRVRAVALAALSRLRPLPASAALRDTPLARRERFLLAWLDAHDARAAEPLGPELCEVYADAAHVEIGRPLAGRCLNCHAGAAPAALSASDTCAGCHKRVHADWRTSAHAQSLSHLHLTTVDPVSRGVRRMDFGEVRGLGCVECHRPDTPAGPAPATAATRPEKCPFRFAGGMPAADSCARCHGTTHRQWLSWRSGRQPRRVEWPPGQVDVDFRGDGRSCIDCHMKPSASSEGRNPRNHRWAARRSIQLLREGADVRAVQVGAAAGEREVRLTLTNLSGHAYPTGTRRRGVELHAGPAEGDNLLPIATLSPLRPGRLCPANQPALDPGEQRDFTLSLPIDAAAVRYRLTYCRDLRRRESAVEILSATVRLGE